MRSVVRRTHWWLSAIVMRLERNGGVLDGVRDWRVILNYTLPIL